MLSEELCRFDFRGMCFSLSKAGKRISLGVCLVQRPRGISSRRSDLISEALLSCEVSSILFNKTVSLFVLVLMGHPLALSGRTVLGLDNDSPCISDSESVRADEVRLCFKTSAVKLFLDSISLLGP